MQLISLIQDKDLWLALANTVINLCTLSELQCEFLATVKSSVFLYILLISKFCGA
jgi:hypothetical protein